MPEDLHAGAASPAVPAPNRARVAKGGIFAATGLFGTIGIAKIIAGPAGFTTVYPIVVFCLAALFLLTAALMTVQITREQSNFAYAGIACFALVAVVGVAIIFWQDFRTPTVTITEMFEPADLFGDNASTAKLQLLYHSSSSKVGDFAPFKNSALAIRGGDTIAFQMAGLADMVQADQNLRDQSAMQTRFLRSVCLGTASTFPCSQILSLNAPQ